MIVVKMRMSKRPSDTEEKDEGDLSGMDVPPEHGDGDGDEDSAAGSDDDEAAFVQEAEVPAS